MLAGLQWGDEGKGKIVDLLSRDAKHIFRTQGGHNAGHTVVVDSKEYHFHLIPSGIIYPHTKCYIGGGTVIDIEALKKELAMLDKEKISYQGRLFISPYAHVISKKHVEEDKANVSNIGSTGTWHWARICR